MRVASRTRGKREVSGGSANADTDDRTRNDIEAHEATRPATECHGERLL